MSIKIGMTLKHSISIACLYDNNVLSMLACGFLFFFCSKVLEIEGIKIDEKFPTNNNKKDINRDGYREQEREMMVCVADSFHS